MAEARAERRDSGFIPRDASAVSEPALSVVAPVCDDTSVRVEGVRALARQLCRRDADRATGEQIGALAAAILGARALCDPAHPRAQQLAELLGLLERRMRAMLAANPSANETSAKKTSANDRVVAAAEVTPPPAATVREPWPVGRGTPARPGTSVLASAVSRSSADLLKELNALEALARAAGAAIPADVAANAAAANDAPASRSNVAPPRQASEEVLLRPQAQPPSTAERQASRVAGVTPAPAGAHAPVAATDPLAELMALSEAERLALFS